MSDNLYIPALESYHSLLYSTGQMKKTILSFVLLALFLFVGCAKEPTTFEELKQAGETAFAKEQYPKAREYLLKALLLESSDRRTLYLLGISYNRDFMLDSAFFYLKRADILHPNDREISQAIYKIGPDLDEWQATIKAIAILINTGDAPEKHYAEMAQLSIKDTSYASAYYYYNKLRASDPENPTHYLELADVARQMDSLPLAIALMDTAIAKFGEKEEFLSNKAVFLIFKKDYDGAEQIFHKLIANQPEKLVYKFNLANMLSSQPSREKKEQALALYKSLQGKTDIALRVDSLVAALKKELDIRK